MRESLAREVERARERLAAAGTWWSGAERLAIAAEARRASHCDLCRRRKDALSPYTVEGAHDTDGVLPAAAVEAIHRVRTDAGRITQSWLDGLIHGEKPKLADGAYVEIVSIVAIVTALDVLDMALGRSPQAFRDPVAGEPSRHRPVGAAKDLAWVATLAPEAVTAEDPNPYPVHGDKNIHRALSLVPQEVFNFFDLDVELYLKDHEIRDFGTEYREISHAQIELIAGRASALNNCYY